MAASKPETYFGQCKCCRKDTYLKNMWYTDSGQAEVYGQMLVECFAIDWMIQDNIEDDKICEECISKLRIAFNFKNQVLRSQDRILNSSKANATELAQEEHIKEDSFIKKKADSFSKKKEGSFVDNGEDSIRNGEQKTYEDVEFLEEEVLDEETNDDDSQDSEPIEKKAKLSKKLSPSERFKQYRRQQYTSEDLRRAIEAVKSKKMNTVKASEVFNIPRKTISNRLYDDTDGDLNQRKPDEDMDSILRKHRDNIRSIFVATNATPIKGHWGFGYACYFCPQQFSKPSQLKQHTFTHGSLIPSLKVKSLSEHIVKLDVTNLKCNICDEEIQALDDLMLHLRDRHGMLMHLDIPNHVLPFSFASDEFLCVKCPKTFDSFKDLSEHMNDAHYRNYECVVCHRGFVNVRALKTHSIAHGMNIFACAYCTKVFNSRTELSEHEKSHLKSKPRGEKNLVKTPTRRTIFNQKYADVKHIAADVVYNVQNSDTEHKCKRCPMIFESRCDLLYHINSVHKPHKCSVCDCTFDFRFKLKQHVLKEHMSRPYVCPKCSKKFITDNQLKKHMLDHEDATSKVLYEEFSCEVCCSKFDEEDDYLEHMKDKHGLE